jgi:hypothetical protein
MHPPSLGSYGAAGKKHNNGDMHFPTDSEDANYANFREFEFPTHRLTDSDFTDCLLTTDGTDFTDKIFHRRIRYTQTGSFTTPLSWGRA